MTEKQCRDHGCCWDPTDDGPWCFFPNSNTDPKRCPSDERLECGEVCKLDINNRRCLQGIMELTNKHARLVDVVGRP